MKKLIVIVLLICIILAFIASFTTLSNVRSVIVNGTESADREISIWFKSQNWLWRTENWLAKNVPNIENYASVSVKKRFPFAVDVEILLRDAFVAVQSGGYYVIIDMEGIVLELSDTADAPYAISGFKVTSAKIGKPLVSDDMSLIEHAIQIVYLFETHTAYTPHVMLKDGQIIQQMSEDIWINFGRAEVIETQFTSALLAYENMISKEGNSGVVNVSNPNQCIIEPLKR